MKSLSLALLLPLIHLSSIKAMENEWPDLYSSEISDNFEQLDAYKLDQELKKIDNGFPSANSDKKPQLIAAGIKYSSILKAKFERGTDERKEYALLHKTWKTRFNDLPTKDNKAYVSDHLKELVNYESDGDDNLEKLDTFYLSKFKNKDLLKKSAQEQEAIANKKLEELYKQRALLEKSIENEKKNHASHLDAITILQILEQDDRNYIEARKKELEIDREAARRKISDLEKSIKQTQNPESKVDLETKKEEVEKQLPAMEKQIRELSLIVDRMKNRLEPKEGETGWVNSFKYLVGLGSSTELVKK